MAGKMHRGAILSRRRFLGASGALVAAGGTARPYLSRAADRPRITHGIQSGDVSTNGAIVWARADRAPRMRVEAATTESFRDVVGTATVAATPDSDFTAKALLEGLPAGQDIFYRVTFEDFARSVANKRRSRAVLRVAVLRPCGDRRRDRCDDRDAEGCRGSEIVGD